MAGGGYGYGAGPQMPPQGNPYGYGGQPPMGMPPMGQPGYGRGPQGYGHGPQGFGPSPMPPFQPPADPQRQRNRTIVIALVAVIVVAVVVVGVFAGLLLSDANNDEEALEKNIAAGFDKGWEAELRIRRDKNIDSKAYAAYNRDLNRMVLFAKNDIGWEYSEVNVKTGKVGKTDIYDLPTCNLNPDAPYAIEDGEIVCAPAPKEKDKATVFSAGSHSVKAEPSNGKADSVTGVDGQGKKLWSIPLDKKGTVGCDGNRLWTVVEEEDFVSLVYYFPKPHGDSSHKSDSGAASGKDDIKKFDFMNATWQLPAIWDDTPTEVKLKDGKYMVPDEIDGGMWPIWRMVDDDGKSYEPQYGDINGDGYTDAIVPITWGKNGSVRTSTFYRVWLWDPKKKTAVSLKNSVAVFETCTEVPDKIKIEGKDSIFVSGKTMREGDGCAATPQEPFERTVKVDEQKGEVIDTPHKDEELEGR